MRFRSRVRSTVLAAVLLISTMGMAAPLWHWEGLEDRWDRKSRVFGAGGPDQRAVLRALQAVKYTAGVASIEQFEQQVRRHPFDLAARHLLALAYQRRADLSRALHQYHTVLRLAPEHPCRLDLAEAYEAAGRPDLAAQELARLLAFHPRRPQVRKRLARLLEGLGRFADAAGARRALAEQSPEDFENRLLLARDLRRAGRAAEGAQAARAAADGPGQRVSGLLELATCLRAQEDWVAAQKVLEELSQDHPEAARLPLGLLSLRRGAWKEGGAFFEQFLQQHKEDGPSALAGAAAAALGSGDADGAATFCARLRTQGASRAGRFLLACVWLHEGDPTALRAVFSSAPGGEGGDMGAAFGELLQVMMARIDERREVALWLARTQAFRLAGWPGEAAQTAEAAFELAPDGVLTGMVLADSYAAAGRVADQVALLRRLHKANPRRDAVLLGLARSLAAQGSYAEAKEMCQRLLKRSPDHAEAMVLLARVARRRGEYALAIQQGRRLTEAAPRNPAFLRLLVDSLVAQTELAEASDAVSTFQRRAGEFQPSPVEELVLALGERKEADVLGQAKACLLMAPRNPRLRRLLALLLLRESKVEAALEHLRAAVLLGPRHFQGRLWLAETAEREGHLPEALEAYRHLAQTAPERTGIQLRLIDVLTLLGRADESLVRLKALEPATPKQRRAVQVRLAAEYLRRQDRAKALRIAKAVLGEDPLDRRAATVCLHVFRAQDELKAAAALCQRMVRGGETKGFAGELGAIRLLQGNGEQAADVLAKAEADTDARGRALLRASRAAALLREGKTDAARDAAIAAEAFPERTVAEASALHITLAAAGAAEAAEREFERIESMIADLAAWHRAARPALQKDPRLVDRYLAAAVARRHAWHKRALALLRQAIERAADQPLFLYAALDTAIDAAETDAAAALGQRLVTVAPKAGYAHYLHGRALELIGQAEAAGRAYATAVRVLGKHSPRLWFALARQLQHSGRLPQAIEAYERLLDIEPDRVSACNNLAYLYARTRPDRLDEAERLARKAVEAAPGNPSFHETLGRVYVEQRKFDKAMEHLAVAMRAEAPSASAYASAGMMYFAQKARQRARMALQHALRLDPGLPEADTLRAMLKMIESEPAAENGSAPAPSQKPSRD
jgi:tetratricopeptide (TPR) repeat protein